MNKEDMVEVIAQLSLARHKHRALLLKNNKRIEYHIYMESKHSFIVFLDNEIVYKGNNVKIIMDTMDDWMGPFSIYYDGIKMSHKLDYSSNIQQ